jgi:iron(III) transport system substrate-binding protein
MRFRRFSPLVLGVVVALLVACTAAAPPAPTAAPAKPTTPPAPTVAPPAKPTEAPKPAAAATVAPPAQPTQSATPAMTAAKPAPADDWNAVVAAAKREGTLVLIGPQGADVRDSLVLGFQKLYPEIQVEFQGLAGAQVAPKVTGEQAAGLFVNDLHIAGAGNIISALTPANAVVPIEPWLTGPNTRDTSMWRGGALEISDPTTRNNIVFSGFVQLAFIYNPGQVNPEEFTSWKDLLNPKWKGKIAIGNPKGGASSVHVIWWHTHPDLGPQYMRDLFVGQEIVVSLDDRQLVDWVARGQYPIGIGPSNTLIAEALRNGLSIRPLDGDVMAEGTYLSAGNGTTSVFRNAPHPNATKVYLDWLLSRDGQYEFSKVQGFASLRRDVPTDHVADYYIPKDGVTYHPGYGEATDRFRQAAFAYVDTITPR